MAENNEKAIKTIVKLIKRLTETQLQEDDKYEGYERVSLLLKTLNRDFKRALLLKLVCNIKASSDDKEFDEFFRKLLLISDCDINKCEQITVKDLRECTSEVFNCPDSSYLRCSCVALAALNNSPHLLRMLYECGGRVDCDVEVIDKPNEKLSQQNNGNKTKLYDMVNMDKLRYQNVITVLNTCNKIDDLRQCITDREKFCNLVSKYGHKLFVIQQYPECLRDILQIASSESYAREIIEIIFSVIENQDIIKEFINRTQFFAKRKGQNSSYIGTCIFYCVFKKYSALISYFGDLGADANNTYKVKVGSDNVKEETPLHKAAYSGDVNCVKNLIVNCTARVNEKNTDDETPLHWACYNKHAVVIENLCNAGAALELRNIEGETPLLKMKNIDDQYKNCLRLLIDSGADAKAINDVTGESLLHRYLDWESHNCDLVRWLVDKKGAVVSVIKTDFDRWLVDQKGVGISVNETDFSGKSPLHKACENLNTCVTCVKLLLRRGAEVDTTDESGRTPLMIVLGKMDANTGKTNCGSDAGNSDDDDVDYGDYSNSLINLLKRLCASGAQLNVKENKEGLTPLMMAARKGNITILKTLCAFDVHPNIRSREGKTALHYASDADSDRISMIECLVRHGANVNLYDNQCRTIFDSEKVEISDLTKKNITSFCGREEKLLYNDFDNTFVIKPHQYYYFINEFAFILDANAAPSTHFFAEKVKEAAMKDEFSKYLFLHSLIIGAQPLSVIYIKVAVQILKEKQYRHLLNLRDDNGNTALHWVVMLEAADLIKELILCDPEILNNDNLSPLHLAALNGKGKSLTFTTLVEKFYNKHSCYDIDHPNSNGDSALLMCLKRGDKDKIELLCKHGANLSLRGHNGIPALHCLVEAESIYNSDHIADICEYILFRKDINGKKDKTDQNYQTVEDMSDDVFDTSYKRMNVLQYAAHLGATRLLHTFAHILRKIRHAGTSHFDVTYLLPQTVPTVKHAQATISQTNSIVTQPNASNVQLNTNNTQQNSKNTKLNNTGSQSNAIKNKSATYAGLSCIIDMKNSTGCRRVDESKPLSCLELLLQSGRPNAVVALLKCSPFKQMIMPYWRIIQIIYFLLIIIHLAYMISFSYVAIPTSEWLRQKFSNNESGNISSLQNESDIEISKGKIYYGFVFCFTTWPFLVMITGLIMVIAERHSHYLDESSIFSFIVSILFYIFSILWYVVYISVKEKDVYMCVTAIYICIGIAVTMRFFKVFKRLNILTSVMAKIVIRDSVYFFIIYTIFLLSFSLSFGMLGHTAGNLNQYFGSVIVAFETFFHMLGMGSLQDNLSESSADQTILLRIFIQVMLVVYVCLTTIILLNMLIAMMNETYTEAFKQAEQSDDRHTLLLLKRLIWLERTFPKCFRHIYALLSSSKISYSELNSAWTIDVGVELQENLDYQL